MTTEPETTEFGCSNDLLDSRLRELIAFKRNALAFKLNELKQLQDFIDLNEVPVCVKANLCHALKAFQIGNLIV